MTQTTLSRPGSPSLGGWTKMSLKAAQIAANGLVAPPDDTGDGYCAVMMRPDAASIKALQPYCKTPPDKMHMTLVMLGKVDDLKAKGYSLATMEQALEQVRAWNIPLEATAGGVTRFHAASGPDPVVLSINSRGLQGFRTQVIAALAQAGLHEETEHGYTPHLTVGYVPKGQPLTLKHFPPIPIKFDAIILGFGDQHADLVMRDNGMHDDKMPTTGMKVKAAMVKCSVCGEEYAIDNMDEVHKHEGKACPAPTHTAATAAKGKRATAAAAGGQSPAKSARKRVKKSGETAKEKAARLANNAAARKRRAGCKSYAEQLELKIARVSGTCSPQQTAAKAAKKARQTAKKAGAKAAKKGTPKKVKAQKSGALRRAAKKSANAAASKCPPKSGKPYQQNMTAASKDLFNGMPGLVQRYQHGLKPVQRGKRRTLRQMAVSMARNETELKALPRDGDGDGFIFDATHPEPAPVGTPVGRYSTYAGVSDVEGFHEIDGDNGKTYELGQDSEHPEDGFFALEKQKNIKDFWKGEVANEPTAKATVRALDKVIGDDLKASGTPRTRTVKKAAPAKKAAKKATSTARGSAAKKAATTKKAAAAKKTPSAQKRVLWQLPWSKLTAQEKADQIAQRGKIPPKTTSLGVITPAVIKRVRAKNLTRGDRTLEQRVERIKSQGWTLITDDAERHGLSAEYGKPLPPGWTHVFKYTGPDAADRGYTVQGLDWTWKAQPFQRTTKRSEALDEKFARGRAFVSKIPKLDTATQRECLKNPVALVVRLQLLTGGRIDSGGSKQTTGARGLSSLQAKDVKVNGMGVTIKFPGKSGVTNTYAFRDKTVATALQNLLNKAESPSSPLWEDVDDKDTLAYIKAKCGAEFTNHDLRTAKCNAVAQQALMAEVQEHGLPDLTDEAAIKALVSRVSQAAGKQINDPATTAYGNYIDPLIFAQAGIPIDKLPATVSNAPKPKKKTTRRTK